MKNIILLLILLLIGISHASADSSHSGVVRKQEKKVKSRWSLAEWMTQKQNSKWQDQWLALNTSDNPFEFFLEGESAETKHYLSSSKNDVEKFRHTRGRIGAYASIVGLEGGFEAPTKGWSAWDASFNFRLMGTAQQNTNITLIGGAKTYSYEDPNTQKTERWQNPYAGIGMTLYLTKFFGFEGSYRKLFPEKSNFKNSLEGENSRAVAFIDFSFVRIYGGLTKEYLIFNNKTDSRYSENRDGYTGGIRLWF